MKYTRWSRWTYLVRYHLVWCTCRRKSVLVGNVARDCEDLIREKCVDEGWVIEELDIQPDHVHLVVQCWPMDAPSDVIKEFKRATSGPLREKHPELRKVPSLWIRSFFASTEADVSPETVAQFLATQSGL